MEAIFISLSPSARHPSYHQISTFTPGFKDDADNLFSESDRTARLSESIKRTVLYFLEDDFYKETNLKLYRLLEDVLRDIQRETLIRFIKVSKLLNR